MILEMKKLKFINAPGFFHILTKDREKVIKYKSKKYRIRLFVILHTIQDSLTFKENQVYKTEENEEMKNI